MNTAKNIADMTYYANTKQVEVELGIAYIELEQATVRAKNAPTGGSLADAIERNRAKRSLEEAEYNVKRLERILSAFMDWDAEDLARSGEL